MGLKVEPTAKGDHLPDFVERSPPNGISVLVIGSGIGGLTTARELWRRGCEVEVFERRANPVFTGDSFSIGPSAIKSLRNWPRLHTEFIEIGYKPRAIIRTLNGDKIRGPFELRDVLVRSGDPSELPEIWRHTRPKLYQIMLEHLERIGINVQYSKSVVDYFEDDKSRRAGVVLADGSRHEADLVVAADSVGTNSWRLIAGHKVAARSSGTAMFRCAYPVEYALQDPMVAERFPLPEDGRPIVEIWLGSPIRLAFSRTKDEFHWSLTHADDGRAAESWDHHPSHENALAYTELVPNLPEIVDRVIKTTPPGVLLDWRLLWRDPQPTWTSPAGLVVQLGDAAHTLLPTSGNGATQAMEDGVSLATCLSIAGKENIGLATRVHNLLRFERVSCLQAMGVINQVKQSGVGKKPGDDPNKALPELGKWIFGHDPEEYAMQKYHEALSHLENGTPYANTNKPAGLEYKPWTIDGLIAVCEQGEVNPLGGDWS